MDAGSGATGSPAAVPVPDAGDDTLRDEMAETIRENWYSVMQRRHDGTSVLVLAAEHAADALLPLIRDRIAAVVQAERERIAQEIAQQVPESDPGPGTYNREWGSGLRSGLGRAAVIARGGPSMTADDLTRRDPALLRRAIIAAHDAEHPAQGSDDVSTYPPLTKREAAIVEAWRADREDLLKGGAATAMDILARAEKAEAERDKHSEEFGGLTECGGEGVDCDTHPVTLVDHEGPVSCVWCALDAARQRAQTAEAAIERARTLTDVSGWHVYESRDTGDVYLADTVRDRMAEVRAALDRTEATDPLTPFRELLDRWVELGRSEGIHGQQLREAIETAEKKGIA